MYIFAKKAMLAIDAALRIDETTQIILRKHEELQNFIKTHCQLRTYSFQVYKIYYYKKIILYNILFI